MDESSGREMLVSVLWSENTEEYQVTARTLAIQIQAGRSKRGSPEPPDRYRIHDVVYAFIKLMVSRRTIVAG